MRGEPFVPVFWLATLCACSSSQKQHAGTQSPSASASASILNSDLTSTSPIENPTLRAGRYDLTLVADRGSRKGAASVGFLTLVPASATDKSSATGEIVRDLDRLPIFYGWSDLDFRNIAAPLCNGPPPPDSRDPARPGAIVPVVRLREQQVLLVGTMWNVRDGIDYRDGCGIALFVESLADHCYSGSWDRFGIAGNGAGSFFACPVAD